MGRRLELSREQWRGLTSTVLILCMAVLSACTGGTPSGRPSTGATSSALSVPAGEPAAGTALVRRVALPSWSAASGEGSLLMAYDAPGRCYFRRVDRNGSVAG